MPGSPSVKKPLFSRTGLTLLVAGSLLLCLLPISSELLIGLPVERRISFVINQSLLMGTGLFFLFCVVTFLGALFALLFKSVRSTAVRALLISVAAMIFLSCGMLSSHVIRTKQFEALAERSRPLIAAISRFEKEHGKPPVKLDELVPTYLKEVPHTGMGAYPDYEYKVSTIEPGPDRLAATWELSVPCSIGILNWDVFYYLPTEKYPKHDYGGSIEPIKNWAYVHE
jgi:hypothetical protein